MAVKVADAHAVPVPRSDAEAFPECVGDCVFEIDCEGLPENVVLIDPQCVELALTVVQMLAAEDAEEHGEGAEDAEEHTDTEKMLLKVTDTV